jgi:DHA3 family tetracycline resistance protein-like MFS transporter
MKKKLALVELARHREPRLLVFGQAVSSFGDGVSVVALTLLILTTTHSASELSWFVAARMIPLVVFLLLGGAIVDRFSRRTLLLISDTARALLTGILVVMLGTGVLRFWELLIFGVLFGAFDAVFMPAISALTPEIVSEDLLPAMNAVRPLANNLMGQMIGPAVGGAIAAVSTTWAIGIDCATFAISSASLFAMKPTPAPVRTLGTSMLSEIRAGVRYMRSIRWFLSGLSVVSLMNALVFVPMGVLIPYFLLHDLHTSKILVGYTFAVMGLSGAVGALVAANLKTPKRRVRVAFTYWMIASLSALVFAFATDWWEVLIFPLVASPMMLLGNVIWESMMQTEIPKEMLGRATSVDWFLSLGLSPVGLVVAGLVANEWGVRTYFIVFSIACTVPGLWVVISRRINEVDAGRVSATRTVERSSTTSPLGEIPSSHEVGM